MKKIKVSTLKSNPNNPRIIKDDKFHKLVESIKDFGSKMMPIRPIVIDEKNIILAGNMRCKAIRELKIKEIPESWVKKVEDLTEEEKKEFIIKDNVGFGVWDWEALENDWNEQQLEEWGLDLPEFEEISLADEFGEDFTLPDGDKEPFQQMTFTFADEQAEFIKNAIKEIKCTDEYKYIETMGNENGNGNALYLLVTNALKTAF